MSGWNDPYYLEAYHRVKELRLELDEVEYSIMAYARSGDDDPEVWERLNREYNDAFDRLEDAIEKENALFDGVTT